MWAGIVYGTLLEHYGNHILLSGGAQIFLDDAVPCDFPVDTYLKVTFGLLAGESRFPVRCLSGDRSKNDCVGNSTACHTQAHAPYVRGRLVITPLDQGRFRPARSAEPSRR